MKKKEKARKCFYEIQFQSLTTYKKVKINILYYRQRKIDTENNELSIVHDGIKSSVLVSDCKFCISCILIMAILKQDFLEMFKSRKENKTNQKYDRRFMALIYSI